MTTGLIALSDDETPAQSTAEAGPVELSAELFGDVVQSLNREEFAGDCEQRRQPRSDVKANATIIPLRESCHPGPLTIAVRDVSPGGIGFLYERPMTLDEEFALVLPRSGDTPAIVLCAVACWQPLAKNLYAIGARYVRVLRDGGVPPLPIQIDLTSQSFAPPFQRLMAKAS